MTLNTSHVVGDPNHPSEHNAVATQVNTNTTDIAARAPKTVGTPAVGNVGGAVATPTWSSVNDGSPATPSTAESYLTPVLYIERHTNSNVAAASAWGNSYKTAAALIEVVGYGSETGEVNGIAARVQSTGVNPVTGAGNVAISTIAESVTASGRNRDCWGANFVAMVSGAGTPPTNLVGVEIDLVPDVALTSTVRPGQTGYQNYTGMMIQSASHNNFSANTGLWITTTLTATNAAYQFGIVAEAGFKQWGGYFRNTLNAVGAGGLYIETQAGTSATNILSCFVTGGLEQLRLSGDNSNPFWFRIGGALKQMVQQTTTGTTGGFTAGAGTAMNSASTSTGGTGTAAYTFGDVVLALKTLGLVAA